MAYEKRICVMKQIKRGFSADGSALTGAVYFERSDGTLCVTPRIGGLSPVREGRYALLVWVQRTVYLLELRGGETLRLQNTGSLGDGCAALLCYMRDEAEPVAFGRCGSAPYEYDTLLRAVPEREKKRPVPVPLPPNELPVPAGPNVPRAPGIPLPGGEEDPAPQRERAAARYDDEAIAEDNYFAASRLDEDAASAAEGGAQAAGKAAADHAGDICLPTRGTLTYYNTVREELTEAFSRLPADHSLEETFPQSRWVKKEGALLGIVYEAGLPRYLCVAVPAGTDPPACMRGRAVFVPRSPFSEEEGFWVIFQDADTGEYVTVSDS